MSVVRPAEVRPLIDVRAEVKRARVGSYRHGTVFGSSGAHPALHVAAIVARLRDALVAADDPDGLADELARRYPDRTGHRLARDLLTAARCDRPAIVLGDAVLARSIGVQLLAQLPEECDHDDG